MATAIFFPARRINQNWPISLFFIRLGINLVCGYRWTKKRQELNSKWIHNCFYLCAHLAAGIHNPPTNTDFYHHHPFTIHFLAARYDFFRLGRADFCGRIYSKDDSIEMNACWCYHVFLDSHGHLEDMRVGSSVEGSLGSWWEFR